MSLASLLRMPPVVPHEDYGFFGPDSVTWKVWSYPTSLTVGFQRAVTIEELDPALVAAVDQTQAIVTRSRTRYDRTLRYFAMVAFADSGSTTRRPTCWSRSIRRASASSHSVATGTTRTIRTPSCGSTSPPGTRSSTPSRSTARGRLTRQEEEGYWEECAVAAELQTCSADDVPRTREGIQEYFATMRPKLADSETAQRTMAHLLNAEIMLPPVPRLLRPGNRVVARVLRAGTIATMPHWMRRMAGLRQWRATDLLVTVLLRVVFRIVHLSTRLEVALLGLLSPMTVPVATPILLGIPPRNPVVVAPAEARARYGYDKPEEAHLALRERQAERVFGQGMAPSEEGLIESEPILGALA